MPNPKKIAISGSSGFVGSRLVTELRGRGYDVIRLLHASKRALQPDELIWNSESGLAKPQELNGVGAIIHLAGRNIAAARWSEAEKNRIYDSRVAATKQLVKQIATLDDRPEVFIGASAVGIYGECGEKTVDETQPPGNDFLSEVARDWEAAASPLLDVGVRVVHARLGVVLDPSQGALAKMLPLFRWGLGGRLGNGKQYWSWVAIEDVIEGLRWLLENSDTKGPYNLVAPQPVTNSEFTKMLANAIGRPAVFPAPKFALRLALGEMANALLLTSCRAVPTNLLSSGYQFRYPDLTPWLEKQLLKS